MDHKNRISIVGFWLTILVIFGPNIHRTSALVCYKSGKIECNPALFVIGNGCPFGKLCSIVRCCESLTSAILVKSENNKTSTVPVTITGAKKVPERPQHA